MSVVWLQVRALATSLGLIFGLLVAVAAATQSWGARRMETVALCLLGTELLVLGVSVIYVWRRAGQLVGGKGGVVAATAGYAVIAVGAFLLVGFITVLALNR